MLNSINTIFNIITIILAAVAIQLVRDKTVLTTPHTWLPAQDILILPVQNIPNLRITPNIGITPQTPIIEPSLLFNALSDLDCTQSLSQRNIKCLQPDRPRGPLTQVHIFRAVGTARIHALRVIQPPTPPSVCVTVPCNGFSLSAYASFCAQITGTTVSIPIFYGISNTIFACTASADQSLVYKQPPTCAQIIALPNAICPGPPPPPPVITTTPPTTTRTTTTTRTSTSTSTTTTTTTGYSFFYNLAIGKTCNFNKSIASIAEVFNTYSIDASIVTNAWYSIEYNGYTPGPLTPPMGGLILYKVDRTALRLSSYNRPSNYIVDPIPHAMAPQPPYDYCVQIDTNTAVLISTTPVRPTASYIIWSLPDCLGITYLNVKYSRVFFAYLTAPQFTYIEPYINFSIILPSLRITIPGPVSNINTNLPIGICTTVAPEKLGLIAMSPAITLRPGHLAFSIQISLPTKVEFVTQEKLPDANKIRGTVNITKYTLVPLPPVAGSQILQNIPCHTYTPADYQSIPLAQFRIPGSTTAPDTDMAYLYSLASYVHPLMGPHRLACIDTMWTATSQWGSGSANQVSRYPRWAGPATNVGCASDAYNTPSTGNTQYIYQNKPLLTPQVQCDTGQLNLQMQYTPSRPAGTLENAGDFTVSGSQITIPQPSSTPIYVYDTDALLITTAENEYVTSGQPWCLNYQTAWHDYQFVYSHTYRFLNLWYWYSTIICTYGDFSPIVGPAYQLCQDLANNVPRPDIFGGYNSWMATCPAVSPVYYVTYTMFPIPAAYTSPQPPTSYIQSNYTQ